MKNKIVIDGVTYVKEKEEPKFKVGDHVDFIDSKSATAIYFCNELNNLEIKSERDTDDTYRVYESDKSTWWCVNELELKLHVDEYVDWSTLSVGTKVKFKNGVLGLVIEGCHINDNCVINNKAMLLTNFPAGEIFNRVTYGSYLTESVKVVKNE